MWTSNGVGVTSRKIAHATHDSSHVIKTNLQIILDEATLKFANPKKHFIS